VTSALPAGGVAWLIHKPWPAEWSSALSNWSVTSGSLPPGLTLNASTGVISGTPTATTGSPFTFTVQMQDSLGVVSTPRVLSIAIPGPRPQL